MQAIVKIKYGLAYSLLMGALLSSCSQDDGMDAPENGGMRLTATVQGDSQSRSFFVQSDSAWGFRFESFDRVCVTNQYTGPSGYIFTRGYDGEFVSYTAEPTTQPSDWFAFYPLFSVAGAGELVLPPGYADEDNEYSGGYMDLKEQSGKREDISNYYVMGGKMSKAPAGTSKLSFEMHPAVAILHLGNYDGPKHLMLKFDDKTYWDGRLYVVDYTTNCDFIAGGTVYQTTICYLPGNGEYYVAVPAGRKFQLTDEFGNNIKTTKAAGLTAGRFYNVNVSPVSASHTLQVSIENDAIIALLQSRNLYNWQNGDQVRFCNTLGGDYEFEYSAENAAFVSATARPASQRSTWTCLYPTGDSHNATVRYNMSSQSGSIGDYARKYHLMYNQKDNVAGGIIPLQMTVRSQMALLEIENLSGEKDLSLKLSDGSYWDGTIEVETDANGNTTLSYGVSQSPVLICSVSGNGTYYLSVPSCVAKLYDMDNHELSQSANFARGEKYSITLERESVITGESDFTIYSTPTEWDELLLTYGVAPWAEGSEVRLCNLAGADYTLLRQRGAFICADNIEAAQVVTSWFALFPRGNAVSESSWDIDLSGQTGLLEDFAGKYNVRYGLMPNYLVDNIPMYGTVSSKVGLLVIWNQGREYRDIVLRETIGGKYWNGHIQVGYSASAATDHAVWENKRAVIGSVAPGKTIYLAVPQGKYRIYDYNMGELLSAPVDMVYGSMAKVALP